MRAPIANSLRRLRALFRRDVSLVFARNSAVPIGDTLFDAFRAERILSFLEAEGLLAAKDVSSAESASFQWLGAVHTNEYLQSLQHAAALTPIMGFEPTELQAERAVSSARLAVGGTVEATSIALGKRSIAVNLGGGFHHAHADHGGGFCIFNDVAVAIAQHRGAGFSGRILIVDLDLHDGDGNRALFADDQQVFTISIHNRNWGSETSRSLALELGEGVDDRAYLQALREHLPSVVERERPDLVFYLAGSDPAADDALGNWEISPAGMLDRDLYVSQLVRSERTPLVVLLAGGYGRNAWRYSARYISALLNAGEAIEPPSTDDSTLSHYRDISRKLDPAQLTAEPAGDSDWGLSEADLLGDLGAHTRRTRFLDFYTPHGIELALENAGFLDRLRELGFDNPTVAVDLDNPSGQTVRIFGDVRSTEPVAELRASRDKVSVAGAELLRIEWLLLQDPRHDFPPERTALPGQDYPGLGLLKDVMALLVVVCERVGLDGVLMVPAHFHIAAIARKHMIFLHEKDAQRFAAMARALASVSLEHFALAFAQGRVVNDHTGQSVQWEPAPMLLATSSTLAHRVRDANRARRSSQNRRGPRYRLMMPDQNDQPE